MGFNCKGKDNKKYQITWIKVKDAYVPVSVVCENKLSKPLNSTVAPAPTPTPAPKIYGCNFLDKIGQLVNFTFSYITTYSWKDYSRNATLEYIENENQWRLSQDSVLLYTTDDLFSAWSFATNIIPGHFVGEVWYGNISQFNDCEELPTLPIMYGCGFLDENSNLINFTFSYLTAYSWEDYENNATLQYIDNQWIITQNSITLYTTDNLFSVWYFASNLSDHFVGEVWYGNISQFNDCPPLPDPLIDYDLYGWGPNNSQQLGLEVEKNIKTPTLIDEEYIDVSSGQFHSIALKTNGDIYAWGDNTYGQIGDGTKITCLSPTYIDSGYIAISCGHFHSIGLKANGDIYAWGSNEYGQLGDGTKINSLIPKFIDSGYSSISAGGDHTLALKNNGDIYAWGLNQYGQLGNNKFKGFGTGGGSDWIGGEKDEDFNSYYPTFIDSGYSYIFAGSVSSFALKANGDLYAWGNNTIDGKIGWMGISTYNIVSFPTLVKSNSGFVSISVGPGHVLALKANGDLYSWGYNQDGQLGKGDSSSSISVSPILIGSNYVNISAGGGWYTYNSTLPHIGFSMAVKENGNLYAWGSNINNQIGDAPSSSPKLIGSGYSKSCASRCWFASFGEGYQYSTAIKSNGGLYSWGNNNKGQLGNGNIVPDFYYSPVRIDNNKFSKVSGQLGLKSDGRLYAWGRNDYGQIGDGTYESSNIPKLIGSDFINIFSKVTTCFAIKSNGDLYAWGSNNYGQLGDGTYTGSNIPKLVGPNFVDISSDGYTVLGLKSNGDVYVWGSGYSTFFPGTPPNFSDSYRVPKTPIFVDNGYSAVGSSLAAGNYTSVAGSILLKNNGNLYTFLGAETNNQGTFTAIIKPVLLDSGVYTSITSGWNHHLALKENGDLYAWGSNDSGQFGNGSTSGDGFPTPVKIGSGFSYISAGYRCSMGIKLDGRLYAWGNNYQGQLGTGSTEKVLLWKTLVGNDFISVDVGVQTAVHGLRLPVPVSSPTPTPTPKPTRTPLPTRSPTPTPTLTPPGFTNPPTPTPISNIDFNLYSWGYNSNCQLGRSTYYSSDCSSPVLTSYQFFKIIGGHDHSLGLKYSGDLYSWGNNNYGQLGDDSVSGKSCSPKLIGTDFVFIECGPYCSMGIKSNGDLYAWGWNVYGQLGTGNLVNRYTPTKIGESFIKISITYHSLGIKDNGDLYAWGDNVYGKLGDGTVARKLTPTKIGEGFIDVACGANHSLGIKSNGDLYAWGRNAIGDGKNKIIPTKIGSNFIKAVAGWDFSIGLNSSGDLYILGETPKKIGIKFIDISAGYYHWLALDYKNNLYSIGDGTYGQLGLSSCGSVNNLKKIGENYSSIGCGFYHSLALKYSPTTPTPTPAPSPTPVPPDFTYPPLQVKLFDKYSWIDMPEPYRSYLNQAADRWSVYINYNPSVFETIRQEHLLDYGSVWQGMKVESFVIFNDDLPVIAYCGLTSGYMVGEKFGTARFVVGINTYYDQYFTEQDWINVLTHELGHAIGIGTLWSGDLENFPKPIFNFLDGEAYTRGQEAYNSITGLIRDKIPLESSGGAGTASGHWENNYRSVDSDQNLPQGPNDVGYPGVVNELMAGFYSPGFNPIISDLTIKTIVDFGYEELNPGANEGVPITSTGVGFTKDTKMFKMDCSCESHNTSNLNLNSIEVIENKPGVKLIRKTPDVIKFFNSLHLKNNSPT